MRTCLFFAALLSAPVVLADDMPSGANPDTSKSESAASTMPVDGPATQAAQSPPLYRHPTLFGMLRRSNEIRKRVGLFPHRINPALTNAAQDHANYMAQTGQFSHYTNLGPQGRANKYGFRGGVRENIAYGTATIEGAFAMWQNSGAHYASIVSGTTEAGFGYAVSANGLAYWVGVYATPAQGDETGQTEDAVALAVAEDEKKAEVAKAVAQTEPDDASVVAASFVSPIEPQPADGPTGEKPAANADAAATQPTAYYYSDSPRNRRLFRRRS